MLEDVSGQPRPPKLHQFAGYFLPYPDTKYEGVVTTIQDDPPMLNWVYVDKDTFEVKYGLRVDAQPHHTGPFDCTRQDRRMTLEGWEGFCAVEETPGVWAVYFDVDDNGLRRKVPMGTRVLEIELIRREKKERKPEPDPNAPQTLDEKMEELKNQQDAEEDEMKRAEGYAVGQETPQQQPQQKIPLPPPPPPPPQQNGVPRSRSRSQSQSQSRSRSQSQGQGSDPNQRARAAAAAALAAGDNKEADQSEQARDIFPTLTAADLAKLNLGAEDLRYVQDAAGLRAEAAADPEERAPISPTSPTSAQSRSIWSAGKTMRESTATSSVYSADAESAAAPASPSLGGPSQETLHRPQSKRQYKPPSVEDEERRL